MKIRKDKRTGNPICSECNKPCGLFKIVKNSVVCLDCLKRGGQLNGRIYPS